MSATLDAATRLHARFGDPGVAAATARLRAQSARLRALTAWPDALAMQTALIPGRRASPALQVLADAVERCIRNRGHRLIISCPPQEGKSELLRVALLRYLVAWPDRRCAYISNSASLAEIGGLAVRRLVEQHGSNVVDPVSGQPMPDLLGIGVSRDRGAVGHWQLAGHEGGLVSVGIGGSITGKPIDGFCVVDDPVRNRADANSAAVRRRNESWWTSVLETRFSGTSVTLMHTRWSEDDLVGWHLDGPNADQWEVINIPALSGVDPATGEMIPDALNRPPGVWMESVREDRATPEQWLQRRRNVGEFDFASMFQGTPRPMEGGAFKREWLQRCTPGEVPELAQTVVMVDPADNLGDGDEAGIITGGVTKDGRVYVLADDSGQYSAPQWYRKAVFAYLRHSASMIYAENLTSGMKRTAVVEWQAIRREASALAELARLDDLDATAWADAPPAGLVDEVLSEMLGSTTSKDAHEMRGRLVALWPHAPAVLRVSSAGPPLRTVIARGSKLDRALAATAPYEQRTVWHVGHLAELEHQQTTWDSSNAESPGRLDAVAHLIPTLTRGRVPRPARASTGMIPARLGVPTGLR